LRPHETKMDTIFALATARGKSGVAVVRVSGPHAIFGCSAICGDLPVTAWRGLRTIADRDGATVDRALVLVFPEGKSFTGENVVELHCHGSTAILAAVLAELSAVAELRLAVPGEFTRQALENGCLDLTQVEGLGDLIDAETEAQRKQAMRVFDGAIGSLVENWRADLIQAVSLLEATIDFVDEDVPVDVSDEVIDLIDKCVRSLTSQLEVSSSSERVRDGFEVAIVGPPNVGKSSLLNAFAGRKAAITSDIAGTTRDVIEVRMDLGGIPVIFLDTAGIREASDEIEVLGVDLAKSRADLADLRVHLVESPQAETEIPVRPADFVVRSKSDKPGDINGLSVSALTGLGVFELLNRIQLELEARVSDSAVLVRERHRSAIEITISTLVTARSEVCVGESRAEYAAVEVHAAISALNSLIGRVDVESVLDEIFSKFCLGK
jgi:tRNA modification GTPase